MPQPPETILAVDDNEASLYATSRVLRRAGYHVLEATTGEAALEIIARERPPLVLLDINLPDVSGIEVCRRIKSNPRTSSTMVLQMSATSIALDNRVESLQAGADSFLVEPIENEELEAVARALLRLHRSEARLREMLAERNLLLKEVNHRIKNSLQLVTSMLNLQSHEFTDPTARQRFQHAVSRVMAIASVHERLYEDDQPLTVRMDEYLAGLCSGLERAGIVDNTTTRIDVEMQEVRLPTEFAVPIALITNELVTNALKYGRPAQGASIIKVAFHRIEPGMLELTVADNGPGVDAGAKEQTGLGRRLVDTFVRQLAARIAYRTSDQGYAVTVTIPEQADQNGGSSPNHRG